MNEMKAKRGYKSNSSIKWLQNWGSVDERFQRKKDHAEQLEAGVRLTNQNITLLVSAPSHLLTNSPACYSSYSCLELELEHHIIAVQGNCRKKDEMLVQ